LPINDDARLLADDPSVVSGRHDREVAGPVLLLLAVVNHHLHPAGDEIAGMRRLAAFSSGDRLDVL
jgi:hypothetical protein